MLLPRSNHFLIFSLLSCHFFIYLFFLHTYIHTTAIEGFHVCKLYHDYNLNLKSLVQTSATWISCQKKERLSITVCVKILQSGRCWHTKPLRVRSAAQSYKLDVWAPLWVFPIQIEDATNEDLAYLILVIYFAFYEFKLLFMRLWIILTTLCNDFVP